MNRAAVAMIEDADGRLLCVWNRRYKGWSLPGGKVEEGETPEEAVARELEEETGIFLKSAVPVFDGPHGMKVDATRGSHVHIFRVKVIGEPRQIEEGCPVTWLTREEFLNTSPFAEFYKAVFASGGAVVKERPIIFSAPMLKALLAGTKSQTRRVLRSPHVKDLDVFAFDAARGEWEGGMYGDGGAIAHGEYVRCPYGVPGDRLWLKETFGPLPEYPDALTLPEYEGGHDQTRLIYRADETLNHVSHYGIAWGKIHWRWPIYMPRWASRITLEITNIRVERLNAITEEDARAEGVTPLPNDPEGDCWTDGTHRSAFEYLWGEINGWDGDPKARATWKSNPFVWILEFKRLTP